VYTEVIGHQEWMWGGGTYQLACRRCLGVQAWSGCTRSQLQPTPTSESATIIEAGGGIGSSETHTRDNGPIRGACPLTP
jgi:hypothetical protein